MALLARIHGDLSADEVKNELGDESETGSRSGTSSAWA